MKLVRIYELLDVSAMGELKKTKREHSIRVAELTKGLTNSEDVYNAAYYHDYIERVGKSKKLSGILSFYSHALVELLTNRKNEDTLKSLKKKLKGAPKKVKNDVIIIKTCDRIDNLLKRDREGDLSKNYIKKSDKLFKYLYENYSNKKELKKFIKKNLFKKLPKLRKLIKIK